MPSMDLIRELKDVRFELNLRGYDCDAVDAFLAKIRGEIAELQSQRERAQERVNTLESQVSDGESDTEGTLRRTLVLAQRLADETVADAKQTAESMVESAASEASKTRETAQAEAESLLANANKESTSAIEVGRQELERAREDATRTTEEAASESAAIREDASKEAERILAEAESAGTARVAALEDAAKKEIDRTREPLLEEIRQLEQTRESLLTDIDALEEHLVEQRKRVRTAVEALRAGMSGSIDDLERVVTDDAAMTTAPKPALSDAGGGDVQAAPTIDIADSAQQYAEPAPTVAEIADVAAAEVRAERDAMQTHDATDADVVVDPTRDDESDEGWTDWTESGQDIADAEVVDEDLDDATELIPIVDSDVDEGSDSGSIGGVVDLDAAPSALFGTDVAEAAEVVDAESSAIDADVIDVDEEVIDVDDDGMSFLDRFGQAMGDLPISGKG